MGKVQNNWSENLGIPPSEMTETLFRNVTKQKPRSPYIPMARDGQG